MQITHLNIGNFQGLRSADIELHKPVALIAGRNGAGKSSLRDAIALALNAEHPRVKLKGELGKLVREGSRSAVVELGFADGHWTGVKISATGKVDDTNAGEIAHCALPFVLDAAHFVRATSDERRTLLFDLTNCVITLAKARKLLAKRGADTDKIDAVLPLLRAGFPTAADFAKKRATEAKGAWRGVTGETYGEKKADSWAAEKPAFDAQQLDLLEGEFATADADLSASITEVGVLKEKISNATAQRDSRDALQDKADRFERIKTKLAVDENELATWEAKVKHARQRASGDRKIGLIHNLAYSLNESLRMVIPFGEMDEHQRKQLAGANAVLEKYSTEHGSIESAVTTDIEALDKLPEYERALTVLQRAVENGKRDQLEAEAAIATLAQLALLATDETLQQQFEQQHSKSIQLREARKLISDQMSQLQEAQRQVATAEQKTANAAKHHADVAAWLLIADALAPDGILGELLADAITPVNKLLQSRSLMADWGRSAPVRITPDMALTLDGRDYALLSESERWRVDCIMALVIAELSGLKLVLLDRFDVLDLPARAELITLLDKCASAGVIETAIVTGTMKSAPAGLPDSVESFWIEHGEVVVFDRLDKLAA